MKLSDFVVDILHRSGVRSCFYVSGGAVLHIVDSAESHPGIQMICSQHEQAAASSADMVSRVSDSELGFCLTTSGPGATNLITGVSNAFFDSIPMICITGQVASFRRRKSQALRQFGFQETDVVSMFKPITKYAVQIKDPNDILFELEKAIYLSKSGRPGPVLVDIPDDFQRVDINPDNLLGFDPKSESETPAALQNADITAMSQLLERAKRPVLLLGAGVNISKTRSKAREFVEKLGIPTLTTWGAKDVLDDGDILNFGGLGVCGPRVGNWIIDSCDLLLIVGSRLSQQITGSKLVDFAPKAKKVMVDIDVEEFRKFEGTGLTIDHFIESSTLAFFDSILAHDFTLSCIDHEWLNSIRDLRSRHTIWTENSKLPMDVNVYEFMEKLSQNLDESDIILTDAGGNLSWTMQGLRVKHTQRLISAWNHSPMGFSLAATAGSAVASPKSKTICIIGDGGMMMSLAEIGTIKRNSLNVKIVIVNNLGHGIQKQTIETWLRGRYVGVDEESGLFFPDFEKVALAFGIDYAKISRNIEIDAVLGDIRWSNSSPLIVEVMVDADQRISPMLKFGSSLSELNPAVPRPSVIFGAMSEGG